MDTGCGQCSDTQNLCKYNPTVDHGRGEYTRGVGSIGSDKSINEEREDMGTGRVH